MIKINCQCFVYVQWTLALLASFEGLAEFSPNCSSEWTSCKEHTVLKAKSLVPTTKCSIPDRQWNLCWCLSINKNIWFPKNFMDPPNERNARGTRRQLFVSCHYFWSGLVHFLSIRVKFNQTVLLYTYSHKSDLASVFRSFPSKITRRFVASAWTRFENEAD